jgi:hypothetical protein
VGSFEAKHTLHTGDERHRGNAQESLHIRRRGTDEMIL